MALSGAKTFFKWMKRYNHQQQKPPPSKVAGRRLRWMSSVRARLSHQRPGFASRAQSVVRSWQQCFGWGYGKDLVLLNINILVTSEVTIATAATCTGSVTEPPPFNSEVWIQQYSLLGVEIPYATRLQLTALVSPKDVVECLIYSLWYTYSAT